jgi:hypothetical protein
MTIWNYRIIKKMDAENEEYIYQVHEVYYSGNGSVECWNDTPAEPMGINTIGLRSDIQAFLCAFRLSTLEEKFISGKSILIEEALPVSYSDGANDYVQKIERASSYIDQILGSTLLLKKDPALRQAFNKVAQSLIDFKLLASTEPSASTYSAKKSASRHSNL